MQDTLIYYLSKYVQENNEAEAKAIKDYSDFLQKVAESPLEDDEKNYIASVINEIISDELNHQQKLQMLFTELTNILPNQD